MASSRPKNKRRVIAICNKTPAELQALRDAWLKTNIVTIPVVGLTAAQNTTKMEGMKKC